MTQDNDYTKDTPEEQPSHIEGAVTPDNDEREFKKRAIVAYRALTRPSHMTEEEAEAQGLGKQPVDRGMTTLAAAALLAAMAGTMHKSAATQEKYLSAVFHIAEEMLRKSWKTQENALDERKQSEPGATLQ